MAEIIKDIRSISLEIESLKKTIASYDKQISKSQGTAKGLESYFNSAKISNSGRLEISGLEKAVGHLTERYKALEQTQEAYIEKQRVLNEAKAKEKELVEKLAIAQRDALRNGDQKGATEIYKQYADANRSIAEMDSQIKSAKDSLQSLHAQAEQTNGTLTRYESVLSAMKGSDGSASIEKITAALREQENDMVALTKEMQDYASAIKKLQSDIADKKIAPENIGAKEEELERWKYQLATLAERYTETAQTARDLATAAGMNPDSISMTPNVDMKGIELPKMTTEDTENVEKSAENMKKLKENADEASMSLEDIINKGIKLGGLTYGAHKLVEFSKQVINIRGEFQKLEVAFSTLLGSEQKANKLMEQLTKTAATTPFDLRSVSEGAKRLLAYGTAAEDVNDILIHLGDIAAGLSQPLDGLVYLYGTTMVQGKMMTRDLRQFQNRGIPIAEQLAKQFGVAKSEVQGLVSSGRVTADEFHKAIMGMASDGGKFGGLMAAQSKTIAGQISNIRDEMEMMFNEIGKSSEGVINAGLSGVSFLIENYEHVGAAIVALIGTYGVYKTALITVTALEAASAKIKYVKLTSTAKQVTATKILTKEIWKQVAARMALNKTALVATAILAGIALATWGVARALDAEKRAQKALNKEKEKQNKKQDDRKNSAKGSLSTLQSDTSTETEKIRAYEELIKLVPQLTDKYNRLALSQMGATKAEKELNKALEQQVKQDKIDALNKAKERYDYMERINMESAKSGVRPVFGYADFKTQRLLIQQLTKELEEFVRVLEEANYNELPIGMKIGIKSADLYAAEQNFKKFTEDAENAKKAWEKNPLNVGKTFETEYEKNPNDFSFFNYNVAISEVNKYEREINELEKEISSLQASATTKGVKELVKQIVDAETQLNDARVAYATDENETTKLNFETALANYEELTKNYKNMTGQQWTATEQMLEQKTKEERKASRESEDIVAREYSKRYQLALQHQRELEDLETEKKEWQKKNPNRAVPKYFEQREQVIELKFKADFAKLDEEFNDWIEDIQRETVQINTEVEISELERAIDLADDYNTKIAKQKEINKKEIATKTADLDREMQETAESQFGKKTIERYDQYKAGALTSDVLQEGEQAVFDQLELFYTEFEKKKNAIIGQMTREQNVNLLQQDLEDYEAYCEEIIAAAQEREDELAAIRSGQETNRTADMVEKDYNARVEKAGKEHGIDVTEKKAADIVSRLISSLADVSHDQVDVATQEFFDALKEQENMLTGISSMEASAKAKEKEKTQTEIDQLQLSAEIAPNEDAKNDLLAQIVEKKQYLLYLDMSEIELNEEQNKLLDTRERMEKITAQTRQKSGKKTQEQIRKENLQYKVTIQSLQLVSDTAKQVADTFGGALSKKSKKALETISQVADFGISAVQGIGNTVKGVQDAMTAAGVTAFNQLSALEKASVILMIISMAVQLAMKIAEIVSQFTKSAQLQDAIDAHLEKVDELKKQQQMIEAQYATSQGSKYYKGLAKSAEAYNAIIKENKAALEDAEELYRHNLALYGADSDKTKEAKEQRDDLALQDVEFQNSQIEAWRSLMEELSGTSLDSFAENLADALIEGFEQGKEGIDDVWEDTMDDLLRTMMRNQLATALKDQFQKTFDEFTKDTKDGVLSDAEMAEFISNLEKGKETAELIASAYYDAMSEAGLLEDADAEGSEGFGQMTQDQADTLTARFTAVQIEMSNVSAATQAMAGVVAGVSEDIKLGVAGIQSLLYNSNIALQMAQDQLDQMQIIADNTAMLAETNTRLKAIEQNTGRL